MPNKVPCTHAELQAAHMSAVGDRMRKLMNRLNRTGWQCKIGDEPNVILVISTPSAPPPQSHDHSKKQPIDWLVDDAPENIKKCTIDLKFTSPYYA